MNEIDFLISNLKEWNKKFPELHIKYAYEHSTEFHIVEVEPSVMLNENKEFRMMAHRTWRNFAKLFPFAELLIDSKADVHTMTDVKYDSASNINEYTFIAKMLFSSRSSTTWKKVTHISYPSEQDILTTNNYSGYALAA